jgi:SPP1 family predicted phage head-tail adaptor
MSFKPGDLWTRITIKTMPTVPNQNTLGEEKEDWSEVVTVWADVQQSGSRELLQAQRVNPEITHQVRCRWRDSFAAEMRINWGGRILELDGPPIFELGGFAVMNCIESPNRSV